MPEPILWLLALGVTARLTRLITDDILLSPLRAWAIRRFGVESLRADFFSCPWCVSVWVAGATVGYLHLVGDTLWFQLPAAALSLSYITSLISLWADREV